MNAIDPTSTREKKRRSRQPRDETFFKVLNAALELDFRKGHMRWTMSDLSRKSAITRSLIYYHFGRSKVGILQEAVRMIGEEFIGARPDRVQMWKEGKMVDSLKASRSLAKESPHIGQFYLAHRDRPTEIGESLRKIERDYLRKLGLLYPQMGDGELRTLFTVFFGVCFSPLSDDVVIDRLAESVRRLLAPR